jgi:hypothetical protein
MPPEAAHGLPILRQKPLKQRPEIGQLSPDNGCSQGQGIPVIDNLPEELAFPVKVLRIRWIVFGIPTSPAIEDAIGAKVDDTTSPLRSQGSQPMRQERIDRNANELIRGLFSLFDDPDAINDDVPFPYFDCPLELIHIHSIHVFNDRSLTEEIDSLVETGGKRSFYRAGGIRILGSENLSHLMAKHPLSAQYDDLLRLIDHFFPHQLNCRI